MEHALKKALRAVFDDLAEDLESDALESRNDATKEALHSLVHRLRLVDLDFLVKNALEE